MTKQRKIRKALILLETDSEQSARAVMDRVFNQFRDILRAYTSSIVSPAEKYGQHYVTCHAIARAGQIRKFERDLKAVKGVKKVKMMFADFPDDKLETVNI